MANVFSSLLYTYVYIDAGSYAWYQPALIARLSQRSGIWQLAGSNVTQYGSTTQELHWGVEINRGVRSWPPARATSTS